MQRRIGKILLWTGIAMLVLMLAAAGLWRHFFRHYVPREALADVRAGFAAKDVPDPDVRVGNFLAARFGALDVAANREKAFLAFFDVDHIKGLNFIVSRTPQDSKRANTEAMARWIANYRQTMSPQERADLQASLNSDSGRAMLHQANAQFLSQDVYYRGDQQPVISELMATLSDLRKP